MSYSSCQSCGAETTRYPCSCCGFIPAPKHTPIEKKPVEYQKDVFNIYTRIGRAFKNKTGVRLSPDDIVSLITFDEAVEKAICNVMGVESIFDLQEESP